MSRLPGTIHIKRKLVEDPLETLYIEREGQTPNVDEGHARPIYRLVKAYKRPRTSQSDHPDAVPDPVPDIKVESLQDPVKANFPTPREIKKSSQPGLLSPSKSKVLDASKQRRVFHLSTTKLSGLSRVSSSSSIRSVRRKRGTHGSSIAVFAEHRVLRVDQMARTISNSRPGALSYTEGEGSENIRPRKRPLTKSTSSQKINDLPLTSSIYSNTGGDDEASIKLASELQKFAIESTAVESEERARPASEMISHGLIKKPMKYKPKPVARNKPAVEDTTPPISAFGTKDTDAMIEDGTGEWVYDVYVRDMAPPQIGIGPHQATLATGADENIGYLVIRPEDEQIWEEFMSDEENSEEDWGGGDEDSNAEDYYGNDYPDELDSDDEWALGMDDDHEYDFNEYLPSDHEDD